MLSKLVNLEFTNYNNEGVVDIKLQVVSYFRVRSCGFIVDSGLLIYATFAMMVLISINRE